LALVH